jgi:Uma2 family endonuclease
MKLAEFEAFPWPTGERWELLFGQPVNSSPGLPIRPTKPWGPHTPATMRTVREKVVLYAPMSVGVFVELQPMLDEPWELLNGYPYLGQAPSPAHQRLIGSLADWLETKLRVRPLQHARLVFADRHSVCRPDLLFRLSTDPRNALAIEVSDHETLSTDIGTKPEIYVNAGIREYWAISHHVPTPCIHFLSNSGEFEQAPVDKRGMVRSPLLNSAFRIIRHPHSFEVVE